MKKIKGSLFAKIVALLLSAVMVLVFVVSVLAVAMLSGYEAYPNNYKAAEKNLLSSTGMNYSYAAGMTFLQGGDPEEIYSATNFRFNVYDGSGRLLYEGYTGEAVLWKDSVDLYPSYTVILPEQPDSGAEDAQDEEAPDESPNRYVVEGYILEDMSENDYILFSLQILRLGYDMRYAIIVFVVLSFFLWLVIFIFLLCSAGHKNETDVVVSNSIDRIPFDLFTAIMIILIAGAFAIGFGLGGGGYSVLLLLSGALSIVVADMLFLLFSMSLATRLKLGGLMGLWKSCIVYKFCAWCWKVVKRLCQGLVRLVKSLPLLGRWGFVLGAWLLVEFIYIIATNDTGAQLFGWFVERALLVAALLYLLDSLRKIRTGAREIASGNESYKIDTKRMHGQLLAHAQDLNNIGTGISHAVDERMKSEHFRTELITNVSHDIKTPLTSIVNYVDLLGKEKPENEKMQEYIDVLTRQSAKLKKLIDDLLEASKASTGNLSVNLERCELNVLLEQTAGEYSEKLQAAGLELVLTKPEEPVYVMADGRHMWRIFDNLMSNVSKYAQPGTRVYLSLDKRESRAQISFRNISQAQLNISGDELMERFVRGDSSRNTEGSGLGLSIARSLVQLQNGSMELIVDGDLFKVILSFATA